MKRGVLWVVGAGFVISLAGCRGSTTPDTEGQTLAQARQTLRDAGVSENNISVTGQTTGDDPNTLIVCDHDPDGVAPTQPVTLEVAANCQEEAEEAEEDDSDKKRKKRSGGSGRRR
jgi:beta-lactam-binding protein with PASTA domain